MTFTEESIATSLEEAKPLLHKHWQEVESSHFRLDPNYDLYIELEKKGITKSFAARVNGRLEGYAVFFVQKSQHYKNILMAKQDIIFLQPASRGAALRFLQFCESKLKSLGVEVVVNNAKIDKGFGMLLSRMGYIPEEVLYTKRLRQ